jgi:leucyl aminopeptidase (aminopeptidase T)
MGYGVLLEETVKIMVEKGRVVDVIGKKAAEYLTATLAAFNDPTAYNLAEDDLGPNSKRRIGATHQEDQGWLGFGHHGLGSDYAIGGSVAAHAASMSSIPRRRSKSMEPPFWKTAVC